MHWDMRKLGARDAYKLLGSCIVPRPIAWVSSQSSDGVPNLAPFSFFNAIGNDPPVVVIGLVKAPDRELKDTASNIRATGEFVISLVSERDAQGMNQTSSNLPPDGDEAQTAGIAMLPSLAVAPQRVASAPAAFECRTLHYIETGPSQVAVIGEVLMCHVQDCFIKDPERIHLDIEAMQLIARMHGAGWYSRQTDLFEMPRP